MCEHCSSVHQTHPTVNVRGVPIDEKLAPLINTLWSLGIRTTETCQQIASVRDIPVASISFETTDDATKFITLLAASNPQFRDDLLYLDDFPSDNGFRCYIWFQGSIGSAFAQLFPTVSVEIPTEHIERITTNITQHLSWIALTATQDL